MATSRTGQGGKSFQDRELAAKVRRQALDDIYAVLKGDKKVAKWTPYKRQVLLKLTTSILPRLNEHSGVDGGALIISFDPAFNAASSKATGDRSE